MNQQPDNFFREKLQDYNKPAPHTAWDRIETSLSKPATRKFAWWKVAASVSLITMAGISLWISTRSANVHEISYGVTEKKAATSSQTHPVNTENSKEGKSQTQPEVTADQPLHTISPAAQKTSSKKLKSKKTNIPAAPVERAFVSEENIQPATAILSDAETENIQPAVTPAKKSSSITLTITVAETDKYLDKTALAEATSQEEKSSTFKKLLKKANDLKSNQDPFGDLREKKNEILALNFKNEKRGQNK